MRLAFKTWQWFSYCYCFAFLAKFITWLCLEAIDRK